MAALDAFRGYGAALSASLPNAVRVLDPFLVWRLGFAAVDDVRRRVRHDTYGHRGRRGADNLTEHAWVRLLAGIEASNDHGQVAAAWVAAQELCAIYRCRDRDQAAARSDWTVACIDSGVAELRPHGRRKGRSGPARRGWRGPERGAEAAQIDPRKRQQILN